MRGQSRAREESRLRQGSTRRFGGFVQFIPQSAKPIAVTDHCFQEHDEFLLLQELHNWRNGNGCMHAVSL